MRRLTHPAVLSVAGLGLLAAAAWAVAPPLGLAALGVACLLLEWRLDH